jgi:hypothetical protein
MPHFSGIVRESLLAILSDRRAVAQARAAFTRSGVMGSSRIRRPVA